MSFATLVFAELDQTGVSLFFIFLLFCFKNETIEVAINIELNSLGLVF